MGRKNSTEQKQFPLEVIFDMPEEIPITSEELSLIETYLRDIVVELEKKPNSET
jgi:hypothetical protein